MRCATERRSRPLLPAPRSPSGHFFTGSRLTPTVPRVWTQLAVSRQKCGTKRLRKSYATRPLTLPASRELAHHYRWRSSKISPAYGDRVQQQALDKHGNPADQSPQVVIYQWAEPNPEEPK